jgi:hypothetical protein
MSGFPDLLHTKKDKQIQSIRIAKRFHQNRIRANRPFAQGGGKSNDLVAFPVRWPSAGSPFARRPILPYPIDPFTSTPGPRLLRLRIASSAAE